MNKTTYDNIANKNQIRIAFNDIINRTSSYELKLMSSQNFIDIFNKKYNLIFLDEIVEEVFDEIFNKKKILADYETTKKCLFNIIVKFSIFERNVDIDDYIKELKYNKNYIFDKKIVNKVLEETKEDIFIEI